MKLNVKRTFYVGFAFLLISMFWQVYDAVIPKILINSFGLNQTWSGFVMAFDNILALFLLPLFGSLSDKRDTKWGKRTPFIVMGTVIAALLITSVAIIDAAQLTALASESIEPVLRSQFVTGAAGDVLFDAAWAARQAAVWDVTVANILYFVLFIGALLLVLIAMATFRSPAVALMPDVTVKPLRSKANAIINLMGTAGGIISLGVMAVLAKDFQSYVLLFLIIAVLMLGFLGLFLWKVNEPKLVSIMEEDTKKFGLEEAAVEVDATGKETMAPDVRKSFLLILASIFLWFMGYNAATTKFSMYAQIVLDTGYSIPLLVAQISAVIAFIPIGIVASKIGRRKTILGGIVILSVAFLAGYFVTPSSAFFMYAVLGLAGVGWATINVNSYPMIVEMSRGSNIGKYTGYYYTFSMAAQIVTPIFSGFLMDTYGMTILFPYAAVFCILAFGTMFLVKHGDSKPIPAKSKLESFDNDND